MHKIIWILFHLANKKRNNRKIMPYSQINEKFLSIEVLV